ncbi:unnamed protein product [Sphenostylis stenocarpa]|uniref:Terpene synthase N-terminal domain-containing protein n=1 Tax=Sphenostylis stenocarpa TaxID=92480 RepID=A0AA86RYM4_9FABA|nr:unnamed protein product [Sphenostylis stenocarpa]
MRMKGDDAPTLRTHLQCLTGATKTKIVDFYEGEPSTGRAVGFQQICLRVSMFVFAYMDHVWAYIKGVSMGKSQQSRRGKMTPSELHVSSQIVISVTNTVRRSANYKPNIWKYDFLQSLASKYQKEGSVMLLNKHVMEVKSLFVEETSILKKLELVDWIQKLGLANHFQNEINGFLESILVYVKSSNINPSSEQNLHVPALCFRLLRNHRYAVLPGNSSLSDSLCLSSLLQNLHVN